MLPKLEYDSYMVGIIAFDLCFNCNSTFENEAMVFIEIPIPVQKELFQWGTFILLGLVSVGIVVAFIGIPNKKEMDAEVWTELDLKKQNLGKGDYTY